MTVKPEVIGSSVAFVLINARGVTENFMRAKDREQSERFGQDCHLEFRIVPLHVTCSVLLTELFNDGFD